MTVKSLALNADNIRILFKRYGPTGWLKSKPQTNY